MPHPDELPEGTDHIINGAMATDDDAGGTRDGGGFVGSAGGDDTGGTTRTTTQGGGGTSMATSTTSGGGSAPATTGGGGTGGGDGGGIREQLTGQVSALRDQAGGRVREFADGGKTRASDALEELSRIVADTADSIDERMGGQYGEYARKASDAVSGFADTLRRTDVDELYTNVREAVRKSPGIAIGVAAVVGFTLARLAKSGLDASQAAGGSAGTGGATTGGADGAGGTSGGGTGA
ncbi:MAG TPA: hypothetical protein VGC56_00255 [Allosphingosinicella sp.]|jgi:hypothetical protein